MKERDAGVGGGGRVERGRGGGGEMNKSEETEDLPLPTATPYLCLTQPLHRATCIFRVWNTYQKIHVGPCSVFFNSLKALISLRMHTV